jgi:hypothetical protein
MNLDVGVIVVGSLYWDDKRDKPHRDKWRNERLQMEKAVAVEVPIRYGRKSESRGDTYTMVFSVDCQLGQGKAIPCSRSVSSADELIEEAKCLWAAEQSSERAPDNKKQLSASWGCVGLLAHPRWLQSPKQDLLRQVLDGWARQVDLEGNYDGKKYDGPDGHCLVDKKGILQIRWPNRTDGSGPLAFDLALATATKSSPNYPSASAVAQAWKTDKEGNDKYFWRNREHGITTFQDAEILKYLQAQ